MRKVMALVLALALSGAPAAAQNAAAPAATRLSVKRVVLYKNGVGYFEHAGRIRGKQEVAVQFTTAQLDDVLKSLTVIDSAGGQIAGVSYNSLAPLSKRLSTLRVPLGEETTLADFLRVLRGTRIEARHGTQLATGRLLSVERREQTRDGEVVSATEQVSLVTDTGEVRTFELTPATSIRIADGELKEDVARYLALLASTREQDLRRMTIATTGTGERELLVSYISEVPIWKSTYRLVLPTKPGAKPLLQGWAIVDNTVGEDWDGVELSLVAGTPQSFMQSLSQPYYGRRPMVALPESAMLTPQTHEATMEAHVESAIATPPPPATPLPGAFDRGSGFFTYESKDRDRLELTAKLGGVGPGVAGRPGASTAGGSVRVSAADALVAQQAAATSYDFGDMLEYRLKERVTIRKNESALVPILQAHLDAEKVSIWNGDGRARRAVWLTNSSGVTLDGGTFNVLDNDAFAGEGLMSALKPGEKRLLSYALDPALVVDDRRDTEPERITKLAVLRGVLYRTIENHEKRTYTVRNQDATPRTVIIEHPARHGWTLAEGAKPEESTVSYHRFRLTVEPQSTAKLAVEERSPVSSTLQLANTNDDYIRWLVKQQGTSPALQKALEHVLAQKQEVVTVARHIESEQQREGAIFKDQERLRENLKSLKGSAEEKDLVRRYTREMNEQEDRLRAVRQSLQELEQKRASAQAELDRMLESLIISGD